MSKRAKEFALEAYPLEVFKGSMCDRFRSLIALGYEHAEKDLALTWEDIKAIVTIADSMLTNTAWDAIDWPDEQKYYEEVLRRFNEQYRKK